MVEQTKADLQKQLIDQIDFLKTSIDLYDHGQTAEAKRLAVSIRVLVHDTRQSHSFLGQLGLKSQLFVDTAIPGPTTAVRSWTALVGVSFGPDCPVEFVPHLDSSTARQIPFEDWWNAPIIVDLEQRAISRKRLVLAVCNKDGGSHVDPELDEIYAALSRDNSLGCLRSSTSGWEPVLGIEHASVRQVAYEVLKTLDATYSAAPLAGPPGLVMAGFEFHTELPATKVGRNDLCPCGSGKKYKRCHGAA